MKNYHIILSCFLMLLMPAMVFAQTTTVSPLKDVSLQLKQWDTEINLDTIDQEKLPQKVTGGLLVSANISNFIIHQDNKYFSSYMKIGGDLGGFIDFAVTKHFAIQGRLVLTAEQNWFKDKKNAEHLWSFGIDLPVLFLARFGNLEKGYLSVGGGPFTHFTLASNIGKYTHNESTNSAPKANNKALDSNDFYTLHDNHSGLLASISYEFPVGVQVMANYMVSLTDIVTFYKNKSTSTSDIKGIYPQRVELGVAYRWRTKQPR